MQLQDLRVIHLLKSRLQRAEDHAHETLDTTTVFGPEVFRMDSCLRCLWVLDRKTLGEAGLPAHCAEVLSGAEAYAFLVRIACGLESRIVGETDIFGQFKEAWQTWSNGSGLGSRLKAVLNPWIQHVFEDTKEIRSLYLQNLGGASYGTLVRKLIKDATGPLLLVGAGQLALSIAPFLLEQEIWITNRSSEKLQALAQAIEAAGGRVRKLESAEEIREGWLRAAQAVVCVPFGSDQEKINLWREGGEDRPLVHLGGLKAYAGRWTELAGFRGLDELFDLEKSQDLIRSTQIVRAQRACEEKAKLRALGGSLTIQHGWEDLALFA